MGYLYVMSNPSFKNNLLKIGKSDHDPYKRKKELETTGVPDSFFVEYFVRFDNHHELERQVHRILSSNRTKKSREFFSITVPQAISVVRGFLKGKQYKEYVFYRDPAEVERETQQREKTEKIEDFLYSTKRSMNTIVQEERSRMEQGQDHFDFWFCSVGPFIVLIIPFSAFQEAIWPIFLYGIATMWCYSRHIQEHKDQVQEVLLGCSDLIEQEVSSIKKSLMDDPAWHTNMKGWEAHATKTIRNAIQEKSRSLLS